MKSLRKVLLVVIALALSAPITDAAIRTLNSLTAQDQFFVNDVNIRISSSSPNLHVINWAEVLQPARGGTGASSFATGSVLFFQGGKISEDNPNLFWDDTNNRLGVGTAAPVGKIHVSGGNALFEGNVGVGTMNPSGPLEVFASGTTALKVNTDGTVSLPKQSAVKVYASVVQQISSGVHTVVNLDTVDWDVQGEFNTSTHAFTVKQSGYYLICENIYWGNPPDQMNHYVATQVNGAINVAKSLASSWHRTSGAQGQATGPYCGVHPLDSGDTVKLEVFQDSGVTVSIGGAGGAQGRNDVWMSITKLF